MLVPNVAVLETVSIAVVCDVLRWGPIGAEAEQSGWRPAEWALSLLRCVHVNSLDNLLLSVLIDVVHYRWSQQQTMAVASDPNWQTTVARSTRLSIVQQLRLHRDFPQLYTNLWASAALKSAVSGYLQVFLARTHGHVINYLTPSARKNAAAAASARGLGYTAMGRC